MRFNQFRSKYEKELGEALQGVDSGQVERARELIKQCEGTVWLIGNGGLASLAEHMAVDLQLAGKRAVALTNTAAITTIGNDDLFLNCFAEQVERLIGQRDLLIAMSGSGKSPNILQALRCCQGLMVGFGGSQGLEMSDKCDVYVALPTTHIGIAQDLTQIILHEITYSMMEGRK